MSHTPGPYRAEWLDTRNGWIMAGELYLAEIVTSDAEGLYVRRRTEREANGELLAAAPTMRDALREIVTLCDDADADELTQAAAKIAKAAMVSR